MPLYFLAVELRRIVHSTLDTQFIFNIYIVAAIVRFRISSFKGAGVSKFCILRYESTNGFLRKITTERLSRHVKIEIERV